MNIYDIAREAGVSIATISRVVNGKSVVSGKTREKVEAVLKKYSYTPDPTARGLVIKTMKTIAILAEDIRDISCGEIVHAIERALRRKGYVSLVCNTGGTEKGILDGTKTAFERRADGIIIVGMSSQACNKAAEAAARVPVVAAGCSADAVDTPNVYSVFCDESYGMMLAVGRLMSGGRRDIVFIQDNSEYSGGGKMLEEGFENGMQMADLSPEGRVFRTERGFDGGFACAETMLRNGQHFNAVICGDDATAAGFARCLARSLFEIPRDISVIGFRNTPAAQCCEPQLTSVDCRSGMVGTAAAGIMLSRLGGGKPELKTVLLPRLIARDSG